MSDFSLVKEGCQNLIPHFYESSFSNEVNHEVLVERLSRECVALVLDEPSQLATSWRMDGKDVKHEREFRVSNGKENLPSLIFDDHEEVKDSGGSRRGTGVFIPRMEIINKSAPKPQMDPIRCIPRKGTGVFLVPPIHKNKTNSRKSGQNTKEISAIEHEGLEINESSLVPSEIILPQEWPY